MPTTTPSHTMSVFPAVANPMQQWLDALEAQNKTETLFELEMWIKCFDRFFRVKNHPLSEQETRDVVRRDFAEEMKIVRSVSLRVSQLCTDILSIERADSASFGQYIETQLKRDDGMAGFADHLISQLTPEDSLTLLIESLADLRTVIDGLIQLPSVSFQTFTSIGKLINREIKRCRHIEPLISCKFKPQYDRIDCPEITAAIKSIASPALRQDVARVFLEAFRLLRYLRLIEADLREDRPLKKALLIFSLINSETHLLLEFIDNKVLAAPDLDETKREAIDGLAYALSMELNKVFARELIGFVYLRQASPIYAKVENSHGLLRNALQQTIVSLAHAFESQLNGVQLFDDFQTRFDESCRLRGDVWRVICYLRHYEKHADKSQIAPLIEALANFRDGSLKFLMFRDWDQYEQFYEDVLISRSNSELEQVLHRFCTYLETLLGQINLRAVLAGHSFDYPEIVIE